jgi:hypothetical protein
LFGTAIEPVCFATNVIKKDKTAMAYLFLSIARIGDLSFSIDVRTFTCHPLSRLPSLLL